MGSSRGVMIKVLNSEIVVSEFEFHSHFGQIPTGKKKTHPSPHYWVE